MDATSFIGYAGYVIAVVSGLFAYFNRDRYKTLVNDVYEPGNNELRKQITSARENVIQTSNEITALKATIKEKENYIKHLEELTLRLPDLTALTNSQNEVTKLMSNNHKEIIKRLSEITYAMTKRLPDGN